MITTDIDLNKGYCQKNTTDLKGYRMQNDQIAN